MNWVSRYVGLPFSDGGRGPETVDCWGLVRMVYRDQLGIDLPSYGEISACNLIRVSREITRGKDENIWQRFEAPAVFDVAVMRLNSSLSIGHVGIVVDAQNILHVESASHTAIERMDAPTLRGRIVGFWRHHSA